jgi:hypothetical protein
LVDAVAVLNAVRTWSSTLVGGLIPAILPDRAAVPVGRWAEVTFDGNRRPPVGTLSGHGSA